MPMTIAENICTASDYDRKKLLPHLIKTGISEKIQQSAAKGKNLYDKGRV